MDLTYIVIAAGAVLIAAIWLSAWKRIRPNAYHRRIRGQSKRALKRKQSMTPGAMITYLRKMNPHAVEEIILDAAEAAGHRIRRNHAYTGAGEIGRASCGQRLCPFVYVTVVRVPFKKKTI